MLEAANYLHKKGIVHRNIRTGNILFTEYGKLNLKLIDFDVAGTKTLTAIQVYGGGVHGPHYCAPEVFDNILSDKSDVWSIGICLYFLLLGNLPFVEGSHEDVIKQILKGAYKPDPSIWGKLSEESRDLIGKMLTVDEHARISAE